MNKRSFILLAILFTGYIAVAQPGNKKIQIVLLGTFHFNQSLDSNSKLHSTLFSAVRQKEIEDITIKLAAFKPDKILVEREPIEQAFWDSLYIDYKDHKMPNTIRLNANEIVQLGFKTAQKAKLPGVICVDFQPENYGDKNFSSPYPIESTIKKLWDQVEQYQDSIRTNAVFFDRAYPIRRPRQDSLLQKSTLKQYLLYINSQESYTYFSWSDWYFFYSLGRPDEYLGVDWLANFWYGRNMRIYANILRQTNFSKDNRYVLIYGSSHLPFIKHLFETNPFFEVVELGKVL